MLTRIALIFALILPFAAFTQEQKAEASKTAAPKPKYEYKLDYVITELDNGKRTDSHQYVMLVDSDQNGKLRVGTRLPVAVATASPTQAPTQFQYMDLGVNIDATPRAAGDAAIVIRTRVEVSSIAMPEAGSPAAAGQPLVRQFTGETEATIPFEKPTALLTMDEPNSKRTLEVQVTATLVR